MIDFVEAVKRPLRTDPVTIILGIVFTIFPPLRPLMHGLGIEASRRMQKGNEEMPHFDDFIDLYLTGLMVLVIVILYFIPTIVVILMGAFASVPYVIDIVQSFLSNPPFALQRFILLIAQSAVFGAGALVLGFLASIMAPIGVQLYAQDKKIGSAFQFNKIWEVASTGQYWVSWLLMMGYGVVLMGAVTLLTIREFSALSVLFLGIAGYLWWMTWYTLLGEVMADAGMVKKHSSHTHSEAKRKFAKKR